MKHFYILFSLGLGLILSSCSKDYVAPFDAIEYHPFEPSFVYFPKTNPDTFEFDINLDREIINMLLVSRSWTQKAERDWTPSHQYDHFSHKILSSKFEKIQFITVKNGPYFLTGDLITTRPFYSTSFYLETSIKGQYRGPPNLSPGVPYFIGFKLNNCFGYIELTLPMDGIGFEFVGWAMNKTANRTIIAGQKE